MSDRTPHTAARLPWSFLLLHGGLAIVCLSGHPRRFRTVGFDNLNSVGHHLDPHRPMLFWGLAFTLVTLLMLVGARTGNGRALMAGAVLGALVVGIWAVLIGLVGLDQPDGPLVGPWLFVVLTFWHWRAISFGRLNLADEWPAVR